MKPKNFPRRKEQRRKDAAKRQAFWDSLSPDEQVARELERKAQS
jgi:hypothetical protein